MKQEAPDSPGKYSILILEDEFLIANALKEKLEVIGYQRIEIALTVSEALNRLEHFPFDLAILDINLKGVNAGITFSHELAKRNVPFIYLTSHTEDEILKLAKKSKPQGYLTKPVNDQELKATLEISLYRHAFENVSRREKERQFLIDLNSAIAQLRNKKEFFATVSNLLVTLFGIDRTPHMALINWENETIKLLFHDTSQEVDEDFLGVIDKFNGFPMTDIVREIISKDEPTILNVEEFKLLHVNEDAHALIDQSGIQSCMIIPLKIGARAFGYFNVVSTIPEFFGFAHFELIKAVANQVSLAVENNLYYEEIRILKEKAIKEKEYLAEEINSDHNLDFFIGRSTPILRVKERIRRVADLDTSILIVGETGTGKELVARSVHQASKSKSQPLIKVNCATLPAHLIESELFGHEKGSFTGANAQRIGKFELADNGMIFLDEIGELPLELQPKLLRVIQEKEIERIGGSKPIKLNVKILAATNRDLEIEVERGNFRSDLYYRLNVFPIHVPPLRERREDILLLANFFLEKSSKKIGKHGIKFSRDSLAVFYNYDWPGNIRELQHVIEREVILSDGDEIKITALAASDNSKIFTDDHRETNGNFTVKTLKESEMEIIVSTLKHTKGRVRGSGGAAELLDINPSTLESRIKKLGIIKHSVFQLDPN